MSDKFIDTYNYIVETYAKELEQNRKTLLKSIIICLVLFAIAFAVFLVLKIKFDIHSKAGYYLLGILFIPAAFYYVYKYKIYNNLYLENYKSKVIKNFVETNSGLTYNQSSEKSLMSSYLQAGFLDKGFNNFVSDDYIYGNIKNSEKLAICNFALQNVTKKGEFKNVVYEGIFSETEINKYLDEEVRINKNSKLLKASNRVEMDSNEFEKYFDVYTNSNILAMEILTHDVMEELVNFYIDYKIKFEIIIKSNHIYVRFDTGAMFEPNILRESNNINTLWVYYSIINFVINLTTKINKILNDTEI